VRLALLCGGSVLWCGGSVPLGGGSVPLGSCVVMFVCCCSDSCVAGFGFVCCWVRIRVLNSDEQ